MNKGLELIEAAWLFAMPISAIAIIIHPQSVIHSLVEFVDGSLLAQLGCPDMRIPIASALAWPERVISGAQSLDLAALASLSFEEPDIAHFPCLRLAQQAAREGGSAPVVLNAANEIAVEAFLQRRIAYTRIAELIAEALERHNAGEPESLAHVKAIDATVRAQLLEKLAR
jgi:1-deoxy-D-xylulose-5-phosphate reductoisomerase